MMKLIIVISFSGVRQVADKVFLYNSLGRKASCSVLFKGSTASFDTRDLAAGCYSLSVGGDDFFTKKIVVVK